MSITFITPSIGRMTLSRMLDSLDNQKDDVWRSLVILDDVDVPHEVLGKNDRVRFMRLTQKLGKGNHAAMVRNAGMARIVQESGDRVRDVWFAFLDDDDTVTDDYVEKLREAIRTQPEVDVFIFTMVYTHDRYVLPPPEHTDFIANYVGISFAMRASLFKEGFHFTPSSGEDYELLNRMRMAGKKIVLLHHQCYHVEF
jgi:GT2 family glycosyltransferase